MDRRGFIRSALYFTVVSAGGPLAGCHRNHQDDPPLPDEHPLPPMGSEPFPQGVASGDPRESSIVFWTRCPSTNGAPVPLRLEVSTSDSFSSLTASVELSATPTYDYTVRAKVTSLAPATQYFYRFVAGRIASPVGAARTAPAASSAPQQLRFAWLSCQDWSTNHWAAFSLLAREELDFVVHVGDYIYESVDLSFVPGRAGPRRRTPASCCPTATPTAGCRRASMPPRWRTTARCTAPTAATRGCRRCTAGSP